MADDKPLKLQMPDLGALTNPAPFYDTSYMSELTDSIRRSQDAIAQATRERVAREIQISAAAEHAMNAATGAVANLEKAIGEYEEALEECEEIAIFVIGGPTGKEFFPRLIQALDPDKVLFAGLDENNRPFTVVQHVSQLNFAMMAKQVDEEEKARRVVMGVKRASDG